MHQIHQIITKEKGRNLIKQIPLSNLKNIATLSCSPYNNSNFKHIIPIMNNSMLVNIGTTLAVMSLFNDTCSKCGKTFTHYGLVKNSTLNVNGKSVYSLLPISINGSEMEFFNKDHIIPVSLNGANTMDNLQFMCSKCNLEKGASFTEENATYGQYKMGIFKYTKLGDLIDIKKLNDKNAVWQKKEITYFKQVTGGLFVIGGQNFLNYFNCTGLSIDKKFKIRGTKWQID